MLQFEDFRQDLRAVIHGNNTADGVYITLRMRLRCEIFRNGKALPGKIFDVLNEVVVDRGSNPYLSKIECYEHSHLITKVRLFSYLSHTCKTLLSGILLDTYFANCVLFTVIKNPFAVPINAFGWCCWWNQWNYIVKSHHLISHINCSDGAMFLLIQLMDLILGGRYLKFPHRLTIACHYWLAKLPIDN